MHWHHTGARNSTSKIIRDLFFPTTTKEQVVTDMKAFLPVLHYLDQSLKQQGTKFLACDNVTIADMFLLVFLSPVCCDLGANMVPTWHMFGTFWLPFSLFFEVQGSFKK